MKKIISTCIFVYIIISNIFGFYIYTHKNNINYLTIPIYTQNIPKIIMTNTTKITLKNKQNITMPYVKASTNIHFFDIPNDIYTLTIQTSNETITKNIIKNQEKQIMKPFYLSTTETFSSMYQFDQLLIFFIFLINISLFLIIKKTTHIKTNWIINCSFFHLSLLSIFSFLPIKNFNIFYFFILSNTISLLCYYVFLLYNHFKIKKYNKYILYGLLLYSSICIFFYLLSIGFLYSPSFIYIISKSKISILFNILFVVANYDFIIFIMFLFTLIKNIITYKKIKSIIVSAYTIYFMFILSILGYASNRFSMSNTIISDASQIIFFSIGFWMLFYNTYETKFILLYAYIKKFILYFAKILLFLEFIYIYVSVYKFYKYSIFLFLILIFLDFSLFILQKLLNEKPINTKNIKNKLTYINDVKMIQYILINDSEFKKIIKNIKIEIIFSKEDLTNYILPINKKIVSKTSLLEEYQIFDFAIQISFNKNPCIALVFIEMKQYQNHQMLEILLKFFDSISYIFNKIRIYELKNNLSEPYIQKENHLQQELPIIKKLIEEIAKENTEPELEKYIQMIFEQLHLLQHKNEAFQLKGRIQ